MISGFNRTFVTAQSDGAVLVASSIGAGVVTSLLPAQANFPLKGQAIAQIGEELKFKAGGILTSSGTPVPITFLVLADNVQIWSSGALTPAASLTNATWSFDVELEVRVVGAAAQVFGIANMGGAFTGTAPVTSPALGAAFDATLPHIYGLAISFGGNTAGNQIQGKKYSFGMPVGGL